MRTLRYTSVFLLFSLSCSFMASGNDFVRHGEALMSQRDFQQAIFFFTRAIEEEPLSPKAYMHRARAFMVADKYQEAVNDYKRALELDPEFVKIFLKKNGVQKIPENTE
ncbi:tetratricopeptide repeat protein [Fulvivirga sp. M361]|uniref:tetratricopeptide repeat protein n=1 Tax=Fulvivirga sp. M361 TaxID=2594266 RepID=UPI00117BCF1C|nr:tetratricopeptide repeat protein [Fulvivirga sp. M361]TRX58236.1 tetratricopeptide repeat protein [Fulvivirga sp. M361]